MKKATSVIISAAMVFSAAVPCIVTYNQGYASASSGINVAEHTPQEIKQYIDSHPFDKWSEDGFSVQPSASYPYTVGSLDGKSLQNSLNTLNCIRYIAGLQEVSLNSEYNELAQAAALVNCVNNKISHTPAQPADMPDDIFKIAEYGAAHSNLFAYYTSGISFKFNVSYGIMEYMDDSTPSNIETLGHRRWCLNPAMLETGFGAVQNQSAMFAFDHQRSAAESGVCWPAQNMPAEYFDSDMAWSISMGRYVDGETVQVTLTRKSDMKEWNFSKSSADGNFYVDNSLRGQTGCIIFRPSDIKYSAGDIFDVKIEGLDTPVEYTVNFFSLDDVSGEPAVYLLGDVNGDGEVNANDASAVLTEYSAVSTNQASTLSSEQKQSADINGDGTVDAVDASAILAYYAYLSTGGDNIGIGEWFSRQ